jgi:hypothetical protein
MILRGFMRGIRSGRNRNDLIYCVFHQGLMLWLLVFVLPLQCGMYFPDDTLCLLYVYDDAYKE